LEDFWCVTTVGKPGEATGVFAARLSKLWTDFLRADPDTFEQVHAEATEFETHEGRPTRRYLIQPAATAATLARCAAAGIECLPIDETDGYSRHEAVPPEWMQIEH
jgi:hypothetical protein